MNTTQRGFARILIMLLVLLVGAVGYFVYVTNSKPLEPIAQQPTPVKTDTPAPPALTASDETANWKAYKNEEYGFQFKYPTDWRTGDTDLGHNRGTFQIFNPEAGLGGGYGNGNKIEVAIVEGNYLSTYPTKEIATSVEVSGRQATRVDTDYNPVADEQEMRSYYIPLSNLSGELLVISIYGDSENFGVLDTVVQSIEWIK